MIRRIFAIISIVITASSVCFAQPQYDNHPNLNIGFYYVAPYPTFSTTDLQFIADNFDWVGGGISIKAGAIKLLNSHPLVAGYTIFSTANNGSTPLPVPLPTRYTVVPLRQQNGPFDAAVTSYALTHGLNAEDFYLHTLCDCDPNYTQATHCGTTYNASNPNCTGTFQCPFDYSTYTWVQLNGYNPGNVQGCTLGSHAAVRSDSRLLSQYEYRWNIPNFKNPNLVNFLVYNDGDVALKQWTDDYTKVDYVFTDNVVIPNYVIHPYGLDLTSEYWQQTDWTSTTAPNTIFKDYDLIQTSYMQQMQSKFPTLRFQIGNVNNMGNINIGTPYATEALTANQDQLVETFTDINSTSTTYYDGYGNTILKYQSFCQDLKSIQQYANQGEMMFLNTYERTSAPSNRGKIESLAAYYLVHGVNTYYLYNTISAVAPFTSIQASLWNPMSAVDIGGPIAIPSGAKDVFGNSGTNYFYNFLDSSGGFECPISSGNLQKYIDLKSVVYARNFTNGLVLLKQAATYNNNEGTGDSTATSYALPGSYKVVNADGTISGTAINSITLRNSEGAVLVKNGASTPTPSPTPKPSVTATPSPSPTQTLTPTPKPSATPSPTLSPTFTATPSASPSAIPTATPSPKPSASPTLSPTVTPTATPTPSIPVISGVTATCNGRTAFTATWTTDVTSTSQVEYGTTTAYGKLSTLNNTRVTSHSVKVSNLKARTKYNYRVRSKNDTGEAVSSNKTITCG